MRVGVESNGGRLNNNQLNLFDQKLTVKQQIVGTISNYYCTKVRFKYF